MGRYRVLAVVIASGLGAGVASAQPAPDFDHAKQLYLAAEEAMANGRYDEAITEFGSAYEITKDPVLFYKIGTANQKAGKRDVALVYFGRYLKEAHPTEKYVQLTKDRVAECNAAAPVTNPLPDTHPTTPPPTPDVHPVVVPPVADPIPPPPVAHHAHGNKTAWILVGGALACVTVGAVLAYSASSSENDISDLYVGLNGVPPTFDATTQGRYNDLVDEGHRYQYLSWAAFGIAGGAAIAAAALFALGSDEDEAQPASHQARIIPLASPTSAGLAATFRF